MFKYAILLVMPLAFTVLIADELNLCFTPDDKLGQCVTLDGGCASLNDLIMMGRNSNLTTTEENFMNRTYCGDDNTTICCPDQKQRNDSIIIKQLPSYERFECGYTINEMMKQMYDNFENDSRDEILNTTKIWLVELMEYNYAAEVKTSTGLLITSRFALFTSYSISSPNASSFSAKPIYRIQMCRENYPNTDSGYRMPIPVARIHKEHGLALIRLGIEVDLKFPAHRQPICLPTADLFQMKTAEDLSTLQVVSSFLVLRHVVHLRHISLEYSVILGFYKYFPFSPRRLNGTILDWIAQTVNDD